MQTLTTAKQVANFSKIESKNGHKVGFVPTMGALHDGHLSLIKRSLQENDITICSIFINPSQFTDPSDYKAYPRQVSYDTKLLYEAGCQALFLPSVEEIYPAPDYHQYNLGPVAEVLEGKFRPGHFNGVASVVKRLFEIIKPHRAYFGLKDYQQFLVIKSLVRQYGLDVEVIGCEIIRSESGLAMSSRNALLSAQELKVAAHISKALQNIAEQPNNENPTKQSSSAFKYMQSVPGLTPEYVEVVEAETLKPPKAGASVRRIALAAARVNGVRLIDNKFLDLT